MEYLILAAAIAVVLVVALVAFVVPRRGRTTTLPPVAEEDIAPARPTGTATLPEEDQAPAPTVEAPLIEVPDSTATRLIRLRERLSRSQSTLSRGLLGLLSRERLDEDTWEEVEDTLLAADVGQLETWAFRVGARVVRGAEGADPASVAFEAVREGTEHGDHLGVDTVIIDTAGRLHTKAGLMDELGKVKRVVEKQGPVDETLLVLDATTGQNGVVQARVFTEAVDVTGIVLTKLDGTAKGGIVIAVQRELGIPVKLVGLGEGPDDLAPFDAAAFVDALLVA